MGISTAAILFVLGVLAVAAFTLLRHRHEITASALTAPDRLRRAAMQLRMGLAESPDRTESPKTAALCEELGAVMQELSLRTVDAEAPNETISSYRQAIEAFRAHARRVKGDELEIHLGLVLYDFGLRAVDSAKLRESAELLKKFLAPRKGKWPFQLPREFYQAALAGALARLGMRLGDDSLLWEALPLCAPSRASSAGKAFKPPLFPVDAVAADPLTTIGRALGDRTVLIDSIGASRRAIAAKRKIGVPHMLAASLDELGKALTALAELDGKPGHAEEALASLEDALANVDARERPVSWGEIHINRGRALTLVGRLTADPATLTRALTSFQSALGVFSSDAVPYQRADALAALGDALLALATLRKDEGIGGLAADAYRKAEAIFERGDLAGDLARLRDRIVAAEALRTG